MSDTPRRQYSNEELHALRRALGVEAPDRGPAQYACGPFWPDQLRRRANEAEALIPLLRLAADALEREIARDPRCSAERSR